MRPKIKVPYTDLMKGLEVLSLTALAGIWVMFFTYYPKLNAQIPTHFDFNGVADGWGSKTSLIALPIIVLPIYLLLTLVSRVPHLSNYPIQITEENAPYQYQNSTLMLLFVKLEMTCFFGLLEWTLIRAAQGGQAGTGWFVLVFVAVLFSTIAIFIARMFRKKTSE